MSNFKFCSVSFNNPSGKYVIRYCDEDHNFVEDSFYPIIDACDDRCYVDASLLYRLQEFIDRGYNITIYN